MLGSTLFQPVCVDVFVWKGTESLGVRVQMSLQAPPLPTLSPNRPQRKVETNSNQNSAATYSPIHDGEGEGREYIEICPLIVFNATLHLPEGLKVLIDGGSGLPTQSLTGQALIGQYNGGDVNSPLRVPFLVQSNRKALLNGRERKKGADL